MWEPRSGVRVALGCAHVWLRATLGPPAGRIFLGFAHLYAAAVLLRFRTMAVAASRRRTAQQSRGVGKKRGGEGQQGESREEKAEGKSAAEMSFREKAPHAPCCASFPRKPIAQSVREFRYSGSGTTGRLGVSNLAR